MFRDECLHHGSPAGKTALQDEMVKEVGEFEFLGGLRSAANGLTWDTSDVKSQVSGSCLVSRARSS
jgi:hypothetical protein